MDSIEKYYKLQAILLVKNLIRVDITSNKLRRTSENGKIIFIIFSINS